MARLLNVILLATVVGCGYSWDACGPDECGVKEAAYDTDGDGYDDVVYLGDDCDDNDAAVYPGAPEICDGSVVDANCDGVEDVLACDVDDDGVTPLDGDCNDYDVDSHAGAAEICGDLVDQDCDGAEDDADVDCDDPTRETVGRSRDTASDTGA